jgi:outer membrane receptor protein involved in Fe transport
MFAFDPPAIVTPAEPDDQTNVIEVFGTRPDQVQKIDRRTYRVKDNPHSAQADSIQLLRGLPAVTITPDDQIQLLGSGNVTVTVNSGPIHGDVKQFLRTLHGSDIERIEIITNPSAEFGPVGTGGIINFVLKHKRSEGLSGSANAEGTSFGHVEGGASVKYKKDKWTIEVQGQGSTGSSPRTRYHKLRTIEPEGGGAPTINTEDGRNSGNGGYGFLVTTLTYDLDDKTSASLIGFVGGAGGHNRSRVRFVGLTPDFESSSVLQTSRNSAAFRGLDFSFDHKGKKEGETLRGRAALFGNPHDSNRDEIENEFGAVSTRRRNVLNFAYAQIDWQHPIGTKQILSLGANWMREHDRPKYDFVNLSGDLGLGPDFSGRFDAKVDSASAYVTFQQRLGTWTVMPGVRTELYHRKISSPGLPSVSVDRTKLFPTFHLDHPLSKTLDLTLSYSKRIDRPGLDQLRPYAIVSGLYSIDLGNPALRDQTTDAYELNLHYHRKKIDAGVIIYDRDTRGLWNQSYSVDAGGINTVLWINAGHKSDRGAEFDFSTPLLRRVKLSTSVNLFDSRVPIDPLLGNAHFKSFRYTGNATLEWDGADHGNRPGDVAQLQLTYESKARSYQIRNDAYYSLNLSYTHSFSRNLSLTATVNGIGTRHFRHTLSAPLVQEEFERRERLPTFKLKLSKTFGGAKPTGSAPALPLPQPTGG